MSDSVIARLNAALTGRYAIEGELGEGGMANVYLADDLRHERKVAIKVLKPELAALVGADRFLGEIKTTANLQHPHILPLFDSGQAEGFVFYVMPYVESESLRQRLDRDVQLPVDEAVRLATAVANALGYAHRQGVIHRDIKPENVLMHEGEPLVADFGIALAVSAAGGSRLTETGLSLGTPYYMSPEQASADRELGPQADIYSVGCMLYEMLVGEPPHTGKTAQAVLAKILTERPRSVTDMRATVPLNVAAAVARSLERLPADRFEGADEFVRALGDGSFTHEVAAARTTQTAPAAAPAATLPSRSPFAKWAPWGVAAAAVVVAVWSLMPEPPSDPAPTYRMTLSDFVVESVAGGGWRIAISPDGSTIVAGGADNMLYVRRSDDTEFRPIPGTERGQHPAISPDGEWLAFSAGNELFKVQLSGGPVLPLADGGRNAHWHVQEELVYTGSEGIYRVASAGGEGTLIVEGDVSRPFMLPGGRGLIHDSPAGLTLHDLDSGESTVIGPGGSNGRYVPTGHILFGDRAVQSVFAVPFDLGSMTVTGDPVPVLPSVNIFSGGAVQLAVSDNGTLVHGLAVTQGGTGGNERLTWFDVDGTRTELLQVFSAGQVDHPRISPDGSKVAYTDDDADEVFLYDLLTGGRTQLTEGMDADRPVWAPDGRHVYVWSPGGWHRVPVDGSTEPELVLEDVTGPMVDVSADGNWAVVEELLGEGEPNLLSVRLDTDPVTVTPYLRADWHEEEGEISPDGRWLTYQADQTGGHGAYLRSFPELGPFVEISAEVDESPVWAPDGSAIYFVRDDRLVRREVRLGETLELGSETELFSAAGTRSSAGMRMYDIHPDGDRFLFVTTGSAGGQEAPEVEYEGIGPVVVVVNWFQELRERMGEGG
jgi:serine/threonine-protein kinase